MLSTHRLTDGLEILPLEPEEFMRDLPTEPEARQPMAEAESSARGASKLEFLTWGRTLLTIRSGSRILSRPVHCVSDLKTTCRLRTRVELVKLLVPELEKIAEGAGKEKEGKEGGKESRRRKTNRKKPK